MTSPQSVPHFKHVHDFPDGARHFVADVTYPDSATATTLLEQLLHDKNAGKLVGATPGQRVEFELLHTTDPAYVDTPQELHAIVMDPVADTMPEEEYVASILHEMERVWGSEGLSGTWTEYRWLVDHYGITEIQDVRWQFVIDDEARDELDPNDEADVELLAFLADEPAVRKFLATLLARYRSNTAVYLHDESRP